MFYHSYGGYKDELAWAAAWLYRASGSATYLSYLLSNDAALGVSTAKVSVFSWSDKTAGAQLLMAKVGGVGGAGQCCVCVSLYRRSGLWEMNDDVALCTLTWHPAPPPLRCT